MVAVPEATPVSTPDEVPIVDIAPSLLLQVPPVMLLPRVVVELTHTAAVPEIAPGTGVTVTGYVTKQPVLVSWNVIVATPAPIPVISPVLESMVAMDVLLLIQLASAEVVSATVMTRPTHTVPGPVMGEGLGYMDTPATVLHPVEV